MIDGKKILHVIESGSLGGAQNIMESILTGIREYGYETVAALPFNGPLVDRLLSKKIQCFELPISRRIDFRAGKTIAEIVRQQNVSVVHVHTPKAGMLVRKAAATAICGAKRAKVVMHIHGIGTPARLEEGLRGLEYLKKRVLLFFEKRGDKFTDRFIFVSENDRKRGFYPIDKSVVIYNGIDPLQWPYFEPVDSKTIFFPARFSTQKDHQTAIKAASILHNRKVDFQMIFAGSGELKREIIEMIEALNLSERISILEEPSDILKLYQSSRCILLSTNYEGQPLVLLEAMASGRPCIATDVNGISETLGGCGLLFPKKDESNLAEKLEMILNDFKLVNEISKAGRERFQKYFTRQRMLEQLNSLYQELSPGSHS